MKLFVELCPCCLYVYGIFISQSGICLFLLTDSVYICLSVALVTFLSPLCHNEAYIKCLSPQVVYTLYTSPTKN